MLDRAAGLAGLSAALGRARVREEHSDVRCWIAWRAWRAVLQRLDSAVQRTARHTRAVSVLRRLCAFMCTFALRTDGYALVRNGRSWVHLPK